MFVCHLDICVKSVGITYLNLHIDVQSTPHSNAPVVGHQHSTLLNDTRLDKRIGKKGSNNFEEKKINWFSPKQPISSSSDTAVSLSSKSFSVNLQQLKQDFRNRLCRSAKGGEFNSGASEWRIGNTDPPQQPFLIL